MNQMYSYMDAMMLAKAFNAELVLAPALGRETFQTHFSDTTWHAAEPDTLLNVQAIREYWRKRGLLIHVVRILCLPFEHLNRQPNCGEMHAFREV